MGAEKDLPREERHKAVKKHLRAQKDCRDYLITWGKAGFGVMKICGILFFLFS